MVFKRGPAEEFIWLLEQCRLGRLWLLVEYAPLAARGERLLEDAQYLLKRGLDVVLALPQNQAGPEAPAVAARRVEYLGMSLAEVDLAAVLARKPQVAVVTDLGHPNPPGSAHPKRWQDAAAMLAAGISVLATVNLTDLEGALAPDAADPRHMVPESFWRAADQLEADDLPVAEALRFLAEAPLAGGPRGLPPDAPGLERLRSCALELARGAKEPSAEGGARPASGGRVMVCLASLSPRGRSLLARGRDLARRLDTGWFVVQVRPPGEEAQGLEGSLMDQALSLGAEPAQITGRDPVAALIDFARAHGVGHIILGRSLQPWWRQVFGRSPMLRLVQEAAGFDLHIVEADDSEGRP